MTPPSSSVDRGTPAGGVHPTPPKVAPHVLPRSLHPGAWWLWALGGAVAASRTTNPMILVLIVMALLLVVVLRRSDAPWALNFKLYAYMAIFIVVLRTLFRVVFSGGGPTVLFTLPQLHLPDIFTGATVGGPVSVEALYSGFVGGLQLGVMVICVGAANALANPKRLLAAVPSALYEFGTVVVVALSVFPQLAESTIRVNRARQLRGSTTGRHIIKEVLMPVLADALDRSLALAGAMDSRGYGRQVQVSERHRHLTSALLLLAMGAICIGTYGILDSSGLPWWFGTPVLIVGLGIAVVAFRFAGRRALRSRYRPDPWRWAETATALSGWALAGLCIWSAQADPQLMYPSTSPIVWPEVSWVILIGIAAAILPGFFTPITPSSAPTEPEPDSVAANHSIEIRDLEPVSVSGASTGSRAIEPQGRIR